MNGQKPWYKSKTIWASIGGLASSAVVVIGTSLGWSADDGRIIAILGVVSAIVALAGRMAATEEIGKPEEDEE